MKLLFTSEIRAVDNATCLADGISSYQLMQRASERAARRIAELYPEVTRPIHVMIGPGNNGGDALCILRLLKAWGYEHVDGYLFSTDGRLSADCQQALTDALAAYPDSVTDVMKVMKMPAVAADDLFIDGLFGSGLNRPLADGYDYVVRFINDARCEVVSIDIPSGLMGENNANNNLSGVVIATHTITFTSPKLSFMMPEWGIYTGQLHVLDIGLSQRALEESVSGFNVIVYQDVQQRLKTRHPFSHKGTYGNAWLSAGSRGMMGAALLAARSCMRSGVGLLTVHSPACGYDILQLGIPEAKCDIDSSADYLSNLLVPEGYTAIGVGPGLGQHSATAMSLGKMLQREGRPMVLDADALNLLSSHPEWLAALKRQTILTPHPKEADRLLTAAWKVGLLDNYAQAREFYGPQLASAAPVQVSSLDRLYCVRTLAMRLHIVIVLKGTCTAVCMPSGDVWFNCQWGNPGMAVGGSGDSLTGIILSLLAQRYSSEDAAIIGVALHAKAADLAVEGEQSVESLLPSDIAAHLGAAFTFFMKKTR